MKFRTFLRFFVIFMGLIGIMQVGRAETNTDAERIFNYAEGLFSAQEYGLARESYLKVLYLYPENQYQDDAQFKIGETYVREGNMWWALRAWEKFIKKYPNSERIPEVKKKLDFVRTIVQQWEQPIITIEERTANRYIDWGYSFMLRSVSSGEFGIVLNKEEFDTAMYWFDKVISEFPNTHLAAKAQYFKGETYLRQEKPSGYEKAIEEYQKVIDNYPNTHWADEAGIRIGDIYKDKIRSKKKAIGAYQKVVERYNGNPNNYYVSYAKTQIEYLK